MLKRFEEANKMNFEQSTQARSWMFEETSLSACKERAAAVKKETTENVPCKVTDRVRKFASGFHRLNSMNASNFDDSNYSHEISAEEQEKIVQFHGHQLQTLVGPSAILSDLRTSETVLSTAIMFFRRFYLSNSIIEINPRKISVACAFFAAKVEEEKVEIGLLSHATSLIQMRVQNSPLCYRELHTVSVRDIEIGERLLMEGLNYEFRCYHPSTIILSLVPSIAAFESKGRIEQESQCMHKKGELSPRSTHDYSVESERLRDQALEVAHRAMIFTDVAFLHRPVHIAYAVTSIITGSVTKEGYMGRRMQNFVVDTEAVDEDLAEFSKAVRNVIVSLIDCPEMDLRSMKVRGKEIIAARTEDLCRVLSKTATIRMHRKNRRVQLFAPRKRSRFAVDFTPPRQLHVRKYIKVTPLGKRPGMY